MPILTKRTILIKNKDGQVTKLTEQDEISEQIDVEVTCAGPHCGKHNPDGQPTKVSWNSDQVKDDPDGLPDCFYRLITLIPDPQSKQQIVFCCAQCAKDYLTYTYVKPLSPKEQALIQVSNDAADAKNHKVIPFLTAKEQREIAAKTAELDKMTEPLEG
jgi:hypothetical protein